jgi:hypothetical protein
MANVVHKNMKILITLLTAILMCGCAVSAPVTNTPASKHDGPIITGRIAKLYIVSRRIGETRWDFVMTDVKTLQDSPALQAHLKRNKGRFVTMIEQPYKLLGYRGHYLPSVIGKNCKVYLNAGLKVIKTEGNWQIPGKEGKYIPEDAQQSAR